MLFKLSNIALKDAAIKVSNKYRNHRQHLRAIPAKKRRLDFKDKRYLSGAFGLRAKAENTYK